MKNEFLNEYAQNVIEGVSKKEETLKISFNRLNEKSIVEMKRLFDFHMSHDGLENEKEKLWSKALKESHFVCPITTVATYLNQLNHQEKLKPSRKAYS